MEFRHVLLISFPAQGHINPALQFAKRLLRLGIQVTFVTTVHARRCMDNTATAGALPDALNFALFSDGYEDGFDRDSIGYQKHMADLITNGSKALRDAVAAAARPVTRLVYTLLLPWATQVARECNIPCALLWIQPATVLDLYYYYFHGFQDEITSNSADPSWRLHLPGGLPPFSKRDLPSFILPTTSEKDKFALALFKEQVDVLDGEERPKVLVNTFDALEAEALKAIHGYEQIAIGPLIPSAFLDGQDSTDKSFGCDLFEIKSNNYLEWLNTQPKSSVVYVSFGSVIKLTKPLVEEIGKALIDSGRPFLWIIRSDDVEGNSMSRLAELEKMGKIVPWCSQLEVLTHPSVGCFVTHCGWNSTLESVSCGVPVVAFPQWTDQGTNAKLIEEVWRTGVRVRVEEDEEEDRTVESEEIRRCIEAVMDGGDQSREVRRNAEKWKGLARDAVDGVSGSSTRNLEAFFA
ncbi:UDP-glycosyltransferase 75C1-like [Andrographis paniculata]|uniref:UDP-glycosyltransferase 75C1-like n=1 Tax=Andrographis paniculata TaxID=175694 RepID=UPI0021E7E32B|nr:UDP-glycosyltransferase 75C1-like [Andrographis paniculata]